ncbi:MAG: type III pantothenate kinase [Candidatus Omnitrophota bacterium]|nr:type III pantothenate kinase [Candidatus Omnitrophota bacterium]
MLLAIDIGNTFIALGLFHKKRLIRKYTILTPEKNYSLKLRNILLRHKVNNALICSVVPKATKKMATILKRANLKKILILGKNLTVPIKNLYRNPKQVGQDRLVNAYAAIILYGAPVIVIDSGTAITFDIISAKKEYLGGMILPGLDISLDVLAQRTALLPRVKPAYPKEFIGRDTQSSILSGTVYGFANLIDGMVKQIKNRIHGNPIVLGTGGNIKLLGKYCRQINKIDTELTLKGIYQVFQNSCLK